MKKIQENISLKTLATFRVGGNARYLLEVDSKDELIEAISFAEGKNLPIFVLGGGSDILVSDKNFDGVVIRYVGKGLKLKAEGLKVLITAEAGMTWDDLVDYAVRKNLQGIECLSGIPGTVGAAPIQNIGAYGQELKDTFVSLNAYSIDKRKFVKFTKKDCGFSYRESIFKKKENWQKYIIIDATFSLKKNAKPDVNYDSLKTYLGQKNVKNPTLQEVRSAILAIRASKFENPEDVGNAGSFFKNPTVDKKLADELKKRFPDIPLREQGENYKGSAGWFVEMAGWKGKTYKTAGVSPRHALVLINPNGDAKASDILELSEKIKDDVYKKFGVKLEREVQLINF